MKGTRQCRDGAWHGLLTIVPLRHHGEGCIAGKRGHLQFPRRPKRPRDRIAVADCASRQDEEERSRRATSGADVAHRYHEPSGRVGTRRTRQTRLQGASERDWTTWILPANVLNANHRSHGNHAFCGKRQNRGSFLTRKNHGLGPMTRRGAWTSDESGRKLSRRAWRRTRVYFANGEMGVFPRRMVGRQGWCDGAGGSNAQ